MRQINTGDPELRELGQRQITTPYNAPINRRKPSVKGPRPEQVMNTASDEGSIQATEENRPMTQTDD